MEAKERNTYVVTLAICLLGVFLTVLLSSCGGWESINIKEGRHARFSATPQIHNWRAFEAKFTENSKYEHGTADQWDWNKLRGFYSIQKCGAKGDAGMIGWRYIPEIDSFQISPYTHPECGERLWEDAINVAEGDVFTVQIEATDKWRYWIKVGDDVYHYVHPRMHKARIFKQMNGYFGGTTPAPHDLRYYVNDLKEKQW